jgi:hypothetical protein
MSHVTLQEFPFGAYPARERFVLILKSLATDTDVMTGIDVQAELRLKNSPHMGPVKSFGQQSPMQRAVLRQQQAQRNPTMNAPPIQTVNAVPQSQGQSAFSHSPAMQPTPPSQNSSPSAARSPHFALQGGMTSPASDLQAQHQQQHQRTASSQQQRNAFQQARPQIRPRPSSGIVQQQQSPTVAQPPGNYYPTSFQKHYDQLGKLSRSIFPLSACGALFVLD